MRIIGGTRKGTAITADNKLTLRPTTDFAKEGLFNILDNRYDLESFAVLDLFSGTGSISYEFVSRGCKEVHAVEMDARHAAFIRNTINQLRLPGIRVIRDDAFHFLGICKARYDIVFADPPYEMLHVGEIPDAVFDRHILNPGGILILEHSKQIDFKTHEYFLEHRNYGNVHFSFFGREGL